MSELLSEIIYRSNLFVNENFTLTSEQNIFEVEKSVANPTTNSFITTVFDQCKSFGRMNLSFDSRRIQNTPNAGGSSVESETLSFELLHKFFNARLLKTEMEVAYFPEGGSITDYVVVMFGRVVGVSVTRAMKYGSEAVFTNEDAHLLLRKKLRGIKQSSRNSLVKWEKQILHVWVHDQRVVGVLRQAWAEIEDELKTNTVVLLTIARNSMELFVNSVKKTKVKRRRTC